MALLSHRYLTFILCIGLQLFAAETWAEVLLRLNVKTMWRDCNLEHNMPILDTYYTQFFLSQHHHLGMSI